MMTSQVPAFSKSKYHCSCSNASVMIQGYTSMRSELWMPDGLAEVLTNKFGHAHDGYYSFRAPARKVYAFLELLDVDLSLTLLDYGFENVAEACDFLSWYGYGWLAYGDNAGTARLACQYGIDIDAYLDIHHSRKQSGDQEHLVKDALDFLHVCKTDKYITPVATMISSDQIKLSHIEEIGYDLISQCIDSEYMRDALMDLRTTHRGETFDKADYTTDDLKALLSKCPDRQAMIRRLKILKSFGIKSAFDTIHLGYISDFISRFHYKTTSEMLAYADTLFGALYRDANGKPVADMIPLSVVTPLFEANVDVKFAAEKLHAGEPTDRIVAMHAGVHTSMTEGWL